MTDQADGPASDALVIARLAALTRGDYDRVRRKEADQLGWRVETLDAEVTKARRMATATSWSEEVTDRPPEFTDEALALRFTERHKGSLRYVASWGQWLIWDGEIWQFDETLRVFDLSRAVCRKASSECNEERVADAIASAKTVAAVERLAKADRRHAAVANQWDADP
jgi:phage/plasmid-associated DNA primase